MLSADASSDVEKPVNMSIQQTHVRARTRTKQQSHGDCDSDQKRDKREYTHHTPSTTVGRQLVHQRVHIRIVSVLLLSGGALHVDTMINLHIC
jgi:hypothetical protein